MLPSLPRAAKIKVPPWARAGTQESYDAFGVFGTVLEEKTSVFHSSSLKMVPKTPNVSHLEADDVQDGVVRSPKAVAKVDLD